MNKVKNNKEGKHSSKSKSNIINNFQKESITNQETTKQSSDNINSKGHFNKSEHKKLKIALIIISIIAIIAIISIVCINIFKKKIKDTVQIELGTQELKIQDFVTDEKYADKAQFVTDISQIDLSQVSTHEITIKVDDKEYKSTLEIKDTTAPQVTFQDVDAYTDYQINPEDFIAEKQDSSNMTVSLGNEIKIDGFNEYHPKIIVKDEYGNETSQECLLNISYIRSKYTLEYGTQLTKENLLFDVEKYQDTISQADIDNINKSDVGEYELKSTYQGQEKVTKITIQDTTPPVLTLKNVTLYTEQTITAPNQFVEKAEDLAGVTLNILTQIDYSIIGEQDVTIEAIDGHGNKVSQTAKLTIKNDDEGPVFSGLTDVKITKNGSVDYKKNVTAKDGKDGDVEFTVDSSSVKLDTVGTYYVTYTASDKAGNTTTSKRKIVVSEKATTSSSSGSSDINAKADEFIAKATSGVSGTANKILAIKNYLRNNIKYSHRYNASNTGSVNNAAMKAFTAYEGDCYIHAAAAQVMFTRLGVKSIIVNALDYTHYWNMVYINGGWKHVDPTPGWAYADVGFMNDAKRLETLRRISGYEYRDWDRSKFPVAN